MIRLSFLGRPCFPVFSGGNKGSNESHPNDEKHESGDSILSMSMSDK